MIAIAKVGSQGVVPQRGLLGRVFVERFDNTDVRLIGFPGGQLVQTRSNNLLFGDIWKAKLSLHAAQLGLKWHCKAPNLLIQRIVLAGLLDLP